MGTEGPPQHGGCELLIESHQIPKDALRLIGPSDTIYRSSWAPWYMFIARKEMPHGSACVETGTT